MLVSLRRQFLPSNSAHPLCVSAPWAKTKIISRDAKDVPCVEQDMRFYRKQVFCFKRQFYLVSLLFKTILQISDISVFS